MSYRPLSITANRQSRLITILWNDAHQSQYPYSLVRYACPCAECRGGHDKMGDEPEETVFSRPDEESATTRLRHLEAVGSYAVTPEWEDGHHYGIYTWNYLRALCPCEICRRGAETSHK